MEDLKKISASWSCELWVECPYCEDYQKLEHQEHFDAFEIEGIRGPESKSDIGYEYTCKNKECKKEFIIDETEY